VPGSPSHLAARFFDVLSAKPLSGHEVAEVEKWLTASEIEVFMAQPRPDRRHGFHASRVVLDKGIEDESVVRAALLHDVGKRHARLGVMGRTIASLMIVLHLPLPRRFALYRDHGSIGAAELAGLGCESLIVDFARSHHGDRPTGIEPGVWEVLQLADQPPKTGPFPPPRIS
jgi:putative nucleotidyltransferase with HDIG domain